MLTSASAASLPIVNIPSLHRTLDPGVYSRVKRAVRAIRPHAALVSGWGVRSSRPALATPDINSDLPGRNLGTEQSEGQKADGQLDGGEQPQRDPEAEAE